MIALLNTIKVLFLSITTHSPPLRGQSAETLVPRFSPNASIQLVSLARGNTISAGSGYPALARISQAQPLHSQSPSAQPAPAQSVQRHSPPISWFKKSTFWTLLLGGLTIVTGLLFFLLQWLYMNWTARKDFIEYCEGLQDNVNSLSKSCQKALKTPLASPPFSPGWRIRRCVVDTTPLSVILLFDKASKLPQSMLLEFFYILLFSGMMTSGYVLVEYCSERFVVDYSTGAATRPTFQSATSWDEKETLENDFPVPILQTGYSTAIATGASAGLTSRFHNIVADVNIASVLMPRTTEIKPKGIGGSQHLRKRSQAGRKTSKGRVALQMKALQSVPSKSDPRIKREPYPDTIATVVGPSLLSALRTKTLFLDDSNRKPLSKLSELGLKFGGRNRGPFVVRIDGLTIDRKDSNESNPYLARLLGWIFPNVVFSPDCLAQLLREGAQQLWLAVGPPKPLADIFLRGLHGDAFILPSDIVHSLRLELVRIAFGGRITSMTERQLFVVDLLFPGASWEFRNWNDFIVVEAFKCAYTEKGRTHDVNSCPRCSPSFGLWKAESRVKRGSWFRRFPYVVLEIGVNVPSNQWKS